jgi:hypothetical protein
LVAIYPNPPVIHQLVICSALEDRCRQGIQHQTAVGDGMQTKYDMVLIILFVS